MKSLAFLLCAILPSFVTPVDQEKDVEHHVQVAPNQRIEIKGLSGSQIEFKSWEKNEVSIKLHVRISASDEEYEQDYVNHFEIEERKTDDAVFLTFHELRRSVSSGFWSLFKGSFIRKEIRGEVYVPQSNPLTTDFSYGSVNLAGMKGELNILGKNNTLSLRDCENLRRVTNDYGETTVESSGGNLDLSGTSSTVTVMKFKGAASLEANYSTIKITDVARDATVRCQSGKITASGIGGNLSVKADYSTITVQDVKGHVNVETKSGTLRMRNAGGMTVDAPYTTVEATDITGTSGKSASLSDQSGSVTLENLTGDLLLDCPYTTVSLTKISGAVDLSGKSSTITAREIGGDWKSATEYSTLRLKALKSGKVTITNKSNGVDVELVTVPKIVNIRNEYASISVTMPSGFSGDVDLEAEYGRVETNLPVRVRNRDASGLAIGKVGTGTGTITLETKSGNIELEQR